MAKPTRFNSPFQALKAKSIWVNRLTNIATTDAPSLVERRLGFWIHFDSQGELFLYRALQKVVPQDCTIHRNFKLVLLPKTERSAELAWKIDFAITRNEEPLPVVFLEFKGEYIFGSSFNRDALQLRLRLAENAMLPSQRIYIVTPKRPTVIGAGYRTHNLETITSLLRGLL